jgi:hypothetical protein
VLGVEVSEEDQLRIAHVFSCGVGQFRACLFGLWLAGCAGKAAMQRKLLCREICCSELNRLASCLVGWLCVDELSEMPS